MYQPVRTTPPPLLPARNEHAPDAPADMACSPLLENHSTSKLPRLSSPVAAGPKGGREPLSRFFTPRGVGWRPLTITSPFILLFALVAVAIASALEYMLQRSKSQGALVYTPSSYLLDYGPMVVAVTFGLLWASIDHDIKRYICFQGSAARSLPPAPSRGFAVAFGWLASFTVKWTARCGKRGLIADVAGSNRTSSCRSQAASRPITRFSWSTPTASLPSLRSYLCGSGKC